MKIKKSALFSQEKKKEEKSKVLYLFLLRINFFLKMHLFKFIHARNLYKIEKETFLSLSHRQ